ncbi:MAG TPA: precorrin-3B C(17)-methyltransferase [Chloroflexota bacterium]|nr:precorrin-3B C(17)-methyltransferase [Chloroflexota bacterium]
MASLPALIAVSQHGRRLAAHVEGQLIEGSPREALEEAWRTSREIVFFGAAGIAVRLIAPLLADKASDPAVVVVDDAGRYAISLISGHEGGANELARRVAAQIGAEAVLTTASEILPDGELVLGIGCSSGASASQIEALARQALVRAGASIESVAELATIDLKRGEPGLLEFAARWHLPVRFFPARALEAVEVPNPSAAVAEAAALLGSGGELVVPKLASSNVTAAVARQPRVGSLAVVGIGPGGRDQLSFEALNALRSAEVVVGYTLYTDMVREWLPLATCEDLPLGEEVERARRAIDLARGGRRVALVSSGDAGIYALAGLVYEELGEDAALEVRVVPGITAASSAAALLGAPLMSDFAAISLSDLHVPADLIRQRLEAAASADLVTVLYNPASQRRRMLLAEARQMFLRHRAPATPVGLVRNAYRSGQSVRITNLSALPVDEVDMLTIVVIGSSQSEVIGRRMVTRRAGFGN